MMAKPVVSERVTSRMSSISESRWRPASWMDCTYSRPRTGSRSTMKASEKPMTAFSGVRSSWLIVARKRDLALFAASAASRARSSSARARCSSLMSR